MKILQFKRNNEAKRTDLSEGELYVDTSAKQVWVGTNNKQNPFTIKAYPTCLYDNSKQAVSSVVVNVDTSGQTLAVTKLLPDGSTTTSYPSITIPGTADYAKKLVTSGSSTITAGSAKRPVYFNNGVPAVVSGIGDSSWKPSITASSVDSTEYYTKKQLLYNKVLAADQYGQFTSAGSKGDNSTPIWIDNGVFKECTGLAFAKFSQISTNKTIKSTSAGTLTTLSSVGITSGGFYMITGEYNNIWYTFWIIITGVTASSQTCFSTSSPYNSSTTTENICIQKTGANIAFKCTGTSVSSQMDSVTIYKLS